MRDPQKMKPLPFVDFVNKFMCKNIATSNRKTKGLNTKIYKRDSDLSRSDKINCLHPTKGPHWVRYIDK